MEAKIKNIYFSDCYDVKILDTILGQYKYTVFDKHKFVKNFGNTFLEIEKDQTKSYMFSLDVQAGLVKSIKNKKHKNVVYLLYKSHAQDVISLIEQEIKPIMNKFITFEYHLISDIKFYDFKFKTIVDHTKYNK